MKNQDIYFRPPTEYDSFLIKVMDGCAHNKCTFCNMYSDLEFKIFSLEDISADMKACSEDISPQFIDKITSLYLVGGDVVAIPVDKLLKILQIAHKYFPHLERVASFASAKTVIQKGSENMKKLYEAGLKKVDLGLESGSNEILKFINKGCTRADLIKAAEILRESEIKNEVSMMLGIGGMSRSKDHATKTAELINIIAPDRVGITTYTPKEGTILGEEYKKGNFDLMQAKDVLKELKLLTEHIHCPTHLFGKHWLNPILFEAWLPQGKDELIANIDKALAKDPSVFRAIGITDARG